MNLLPLAALAMLVSIPVTNVYDGDPPPRFQGDNAAIVVFTNPNLADTCGLPPKGLTFLGCRRGKVVFVPNPCPRKSTERYAQTLCHELGHVNGWPGSHGN